MKTTLSYSLTFLGCVSSCLINVAVANNHSEDRVIFLPAPDISNVACNSDARYYNFMIKNIDDDKVRITDLDIKRGHEDDFPHTEVVSLASIDDEWHLSRKYCYVGRELLPGKSCAIKVEVNPKALTCPEHPTIEDGEVNRSLVVTLNNSQRKIHRPIDFDVTILGGAEDYALLADYVFIGDEEKLNHGQVQVSQNVGYADRIIDKDDIIFHDHAQLIHGYKRNAAAFADAHAAFTALKNTAYDANQKCQSNRISLTGGEQTIYPGFYCVVGSRYNDFFTINNTMTFDGAEDSLFVFVMPEESRNEEGGDVILDIDRGAHYALVNGAKANNIYWIGADRIQVDTGVNFVGTFLTKGEVHAYPDSQPPFLSPASIKGRIIGLTDESNVDTEHFESEIVLDGNSILKP